MYMYSTRMVERPKSEQVPKSEHFGIPQAGSFFPRPKKVYDGGGACSYDCDASSELSGARAGGALTELAWQAWEGARENQAKPTKQLSSPSPRGT